MTSPRQQIEIDFEAPVVYLPHPLNMEKITKQNRTVYEWLLSGKTINTVIAQELFITALNSRISQLRNDFGIKIYDRWINLGNGRSPIKEYSLKQF